MGDEIKVLLFRSVRELMLNIVKHAQARYARCISPAITTGGHRSGGDGVGIGDSKISAQSGTMAGSGFSVFGSASIISADAWNWGLMKARALGSP